MVLLVYR